MKKVLFLVNYDLGLYNFRRELVERLLSDGNKVIISSPYGDRIEDFIKMGCEYREITLNRRGMNPISEIKLLRAYNKLLKEVKPDIVFTYTIKPNIYGAIACRKYKIPCVCNITGLGTAIENKGLAQKICVFLYKFALKKAKKVFFQNNENREFFVKHNIAVDKHDLLPGSGVNLNRFTPLEYPSKEKIEFAFISRIMRDKGIDHYLDTAKYIKGKYENAVFHVCGFCEQDYEDKLKQLHDEGIIVYHGMVKDVKAFLTNIHCVIHPSYHEGLSNVLLESASCARPIITTNCAGCKEVVDDGENGYLVNVRDTEDLTQKTEKFISLPYEDKVNMGKLGRVKVEREFDRQIVVEKYVETLN